MTMTIEEIKDLALFAGLSISDGVGVEDMDAEITVEVCSKGVMDDDGVAKRYAHIAYYTDYPEEGVQGLGKEIK